MCGSMADIRSTAAEIRRGKKKKIEERRRKETTGQKYIGPLLHRAAITNKKIHESNYSITNYAVDVFTEPLPGSSFERFFKIIK